LTHDPGKQNVFCKIHESKYTVTVNVTVLSVELANVSSYGGIKNVAKGALAFKAVNFNLYFSHLGYL
jgi:hypothetical protein